MVGLSGVLGIGEVEHRGRQVCLVDEFGVVDDHTGSTGEPDPGAVGSREAWIDQADEVGIEGYETVLAGEEAERTGTLRYEDVGRRAVTLGLQQQRKLGGVAVPSFDLDAGGSGEVVEKRRDQFLAAARVHRDRIGQLGDGRGCVAGVGLVARTGIVASARRRQERQHAQQQNEWFPKTGLDHERHFTHNSVNVKST